MVRKNIVRTLTRATVAAYSMSMVDGVPQPVALDPVVMWGEPTEKEAVKAVKDKYGADKPVMIGEIKVTKELYKISIDDFAAAATKVDTEEMAEDEGEIEDPDDYND